MTHRIRTFVAPFIRTRRRLAVLLGALALLSSALPILAAPPGSPYAPGETLNPSCAPGDANCTVNPPLTGNGTSTQVAFYGTATTTTSDANLTWASSTTLFSVFGTASSTQIRTPSSTIGGITFTTATGTTLTVTGTASSSALFWNNATATTNLAISYGTGSRCLRLDANKNIVAASGDCASGDTTGSSVSIGWSRNDPFVFSATSTDLYGIGATSSAKLTIQASNVGSSTLALNTLAAQTANLLTIASTTTDFLTVSATGTLTIANTVYAANVSSTGNVSVSGYGLFPTLNSTNASTTNISATGYGLFPTLAYTNSSGTNLTVSGYGIIPTLTSTNASTTNISATGYGLFPTLAFTSASGTQLTASTYIQSARGNLTNVSSTNISASGYIQVATGEPVSSSTGANPSATIGLSAVNGSANTFMRSDAAPALSQAIIPTWTGFHTWNGGGVFNVVGNPTSTLQVAGVPFQAATSSLFLLGSNIIQGGSASGTFLGANPTSTFNGDFIHFQVGSSTQFFVTGAGVASSTGLISGNATTTNLTVFGTASSSALFWNNATATTNLALSYSTASRCLRLDANKNIVAASGDCASGDTTGGGSGVGWSRTDPFVFSATSTDLYGIGATSTSKLTVQSSAVGSSTVLLQGFAAQTANILTIASSTATTVFFEILPNGLASSTQFRAPSSTIASLAFSTGAIASHVGSTSGFILGSTSTPQIFTLDTSNNRAQVGTGAGSATPVLFILDTKNTAGDPAGVNGAMYYNSNTNAFRCYVNGGWTACGNATTTSCTSIFGTASPDTTGESFFAPDSLQTTNDFIPVMVGRIGTSTVTGISNATSGFNGLFTLPNDYLGTSTARITYASPTSSDTNIMFGFAYSSFANLESLDPAAFQENVTSSAPNATTTFLKRTASIALTSSNFTQASNTIKFFLYRDRRNGFGDTQSSTVMIYDAQFCYQK